MISVMRHLKTHIMPRPSYRLSVLLYVLALSICMLISTVVFADQVKISLSGLLYEGSDNEQYDTNGAYAKSAFCYGEKSIGTLSATGELERQQKHNGFETFSATGDVTVGYAYDGAYMDTDKENWNIVSDSGKSVNGISLSEKIQDGVFIIQKSSDGTNWEDAAKPIVNFFSAKKLDRDHLYTISEDELKAGTYYSITIAYKMGRKVGTKPWNSLIPGLFPSDVYEYNYCVETYSFYAYFGSNPIVFRDLITGEELKDSASVSAGFVIDKNGSSDTVSVQRDNDPSYRVDSLRMITDAGNYKIQITDQVGKEYLFKLTISEGLNITNTTPSVVENEKKKAYNDGDPLSGDTAFGMPSHTILTIGHSSGNTISRSKHNSFPAYGISGKNVYFLLRIRHPETFTANGWEIVSDSWGKKTSQTINGIYAGQVDSGAIIIQKSTDGINWQNADSGRYADGLYTTDFENHYGRRGDVVVYLPDGNELLYGVYFRIYYAYEAKETEGKKDYRYLEKYEFYVCSNELDAVTFHNLSAVGQMEEICSEYDDATSAIYKNAETLLSGAYTVSGFSIDTSLNPNVTYTVAKNGVNVAIPSDHKFTDTGKYVINLRSAVGTQKSVTIYVDRMSTDEALQFYFGDYFIKDKRIYSEGDYAVFEGGLTSYKLKEVDTNHLPLSGQIRNITTGEIIEISATRTAKTGLISSPGMYEAVFSTNTGNSPSGDNRIFTFRFKIIAEGTAPGPVINQRSLQEYARTTISDSAPTFYAVTYQSASTGYITLAFKKREDAFEYAYNYEKGMVEKQSDGSYRYIGSFVVSRKELYNSAWDLSDAIHYFAEQAVQPGYFDLSNEYTVLTLSDTYLANTSNLRTLELGRSITVFGPGQKAPLTDLNSLPIINSKPYRYLVPGASKYVSRGFYDFKFIRDKYGCDSNSVVITNQAGKEYEIKYNESVGTQLARLGCPTGVVTITETTIYGDSVSYEAIYFAENDNTASITLAYRQENEQRIQSFDINANGTHIEVEAFSIDSIKDLLDKYSLVIVSDGQREFPFAANQEATGVWTDPGEYQVKVVNRLGYYYTISVTVVESENATIRFSGEGTESVKDILTKYGDQGIKLPEITRYGYELVGFEDDNGNVYSDEIAAISFKGTVVLNTVWKAKQYTVTYYRILKEMHFKH